MFGLTRLSIQSKMILLLLAVSLSSIAVIAVIGYESGRSALMRSVESHLQGVRVAKTTTLKAMLEDLREQVISMSDSRFVIEGMRQFRQAYHALDKTTLDDAQTAALTRFYAEDFLPRLAAQLEATPVLEQYLPTRPAERYLQYHYLAGNPHPTGAKQDLASAAGDPTAYGAVHAKLHKGFARAVEIFGFEDLMLVDADTLDVVYSYEKTTEFGSNLADGPYANSGLSEKLRALRASRDKDDFRLVDFETYRPTPGRPMGFALSPIFDGTELLGFLVLQVNVEQFNKALTGNYNWREEGMGDTGESFVVAADGTMRSRSRFMYEDPQGFLKTLRSTGTAATVIDRIARQQSAMNALPVAATSAALALQGQSGITKILGYRGEPVLSAYGPLEIESLHWAVLTQMDEAEAEAPIREFGRKVIIASCAMALLVSLLALLSAHLLTRPLRLLAAGARRLGSGETGVAVAIDSRDEFGQLAGVFNDMAANIKTQTERLQAERRAHHELLLGVLPAAAVALREAGDAEARCTFNDVSVLHAVLGGVDALAAGTGDAGALAKLNELITAFDEAAEQLGVERIHSSGDRYVAACGLSLSLPDHARRTVSLAERMVQILSTFNRQHQCALTLVLGISCGPLAGSVVGRRKLLYGLWGEAVTEAQALTQGPGGTLRITAAVHDRLGDDAGFDGPEQVATTGPAPLQRWQRSP